MPHQVEGLRQRSGPWTGKKRRRRRWPNRSKWMRGWTAFNNSWPKSKGRVDEWDMRDLRIFEWQMVLLSGESEISDAD